MKQQETDVLANVIIKAKALYAELLESSKPSETAILED